MGWKNVKDLYGIKHTVQMTEKGICIGSAYVHDLIVIGLDGVLKKRDESFFCSSRVPGLLEPFTRVFTRDGTTPG